MEQQKFDLFNNKVVEYKKQLRKDLKGKSQFHYIGFAVIDVENIFLHRKIVEDDHDDVIQFLELIVEPQNNSILLQNSIVKEWVENN